MKKKTKLVVAGLTLIGVVSVLKTTVSLKNKLTYEKKKLELESLLHKNFRGKKDLRSFVKNIDENELDAMIKLLSYVDEN